MKVQEETYDVGVLVARFQLHELHEAHRALVDHVVSHHSKVLLVLGAAPVPVTQNNPLDISARRQMMRERYPDIDIAYIKDVNDDRLWSKRLDQVIESHITPRQTAVIYGGRDSFIDHYSGRFPTQELVQESWVSGKFVREQIARSATVASPQFRAGVIWAAYSRHPTSFQTIDVAVFNEPEDAVLLGKKEFEKAWRFLGGFVEPKSGSLEQNARREVMEEAAIAITDPWYIMSTPIDDWRYRNEADGIMTALFGAKYQSGRPTPGDDIDQVKWFDLQTLTPADVMPEHHPLLEAVIAAAQRRAH